MLSAIARARAPLRLPSRIVEQSRYASGASKTKVAQRNSKVKQRTVGFKNKKGQKEAAANGEGSNRKPGAHLAFKPMPESQLSGNPAFETARVDELKNLPVLSTSFTHADVGKAMVLPYPENDAIRFFGVPRNILVDFRVLSQPATVVRDVSVKLVEKVRSAGESGSRTHRYVLYGDSGSGKSYTLLQTLEWAHASNWIVMYIPRAINLVNSSTNYVYDIRTQTYLQPIFAYRTLQRFLSVNEQALSSIKTSNPVVVDQNTTVPAGATFANFVRVGLQNVSLAPTVLSAVLEEIGKQNDVPVLLAVDDFQALFCKSAYKDPQFASIKSWHLSMPRLLLEYFGGQKTFARGAVVGAFSNTNTHYTTPPGLRLALGIHKSVPTSPFTPTAPEVATFTNGIKTVEVPSRLSVEEAASIFEIWMKNKSLHTHANDAFFMEKYSESCGNARDFVWRGLLSTMQT